MHSIGMKIAAIVLALAAMTLFSAGAEAQTVTVSLNTNAVNFALAAGSATNPGSSAIVSTTTWSRIGTGHNLTVYCYFANAAAALTGAGGNIPSSALSISVNGTAYRALTFTEPTGGANAGRHIVNAVPIGNAGTETDSTVFNMDLSTGTLPQLPPGTYTGTLNIRAQII